MLSTSYQGGAKELIEDVGLNEVIIIPKFNLESLTLENIYIIQEVPKKKQRKSKEEDTPLEGKNISRHEPVLPTSPSPFKTSHEENVNMEEVNTSGMVEIRDRWMA